MSNSNTYRSEALIDAKGILRWVSNDACVPMDCLDANAPAGYDRVKHKAAIDKDNAAFFAAYVAQPRVRSAEELSEIRNNLGEDAVDVVTGERIFA
jgi:hypothetical protein